MGLTWPLQNPLGGASELPPLRSCTTWYWRPTGHKGLGYSKSILDTLVPVFSTVEGVAAIYQTPRLPTSFFITLQCTLEETNVSTVLAVKWRRKSRSRIIDPFFSFNPRILTKKRNALSTSAKYKAHKSKTGKSQRPRLIWGAQH